MATDITTGFVQQYAANLLDVAQQKGSRFREAVTVETGVGEDYYFDYTGVVEARPINDRNGDSPLNNTPMSRRRIDLAGFDTGDLIDTIDKVQMLADPTSSFMMAHGNAMGRKMDDVIIASLFATAKTGKDGSTNVSFPSGNQVAVNSWKFGTGSGNAGMTISKLIEARNIIVANETLEKGEPLYIAMASRQISDMLATTEATSGDFTDDQRKGVKALVAGEIDFFMGMNFIRTERLKVDGSSYRRCPVFTKKGLGLAIGKDIIGRISERADKRYSYYAYFQMFIGATRLRETDVVEIKCLES